MQETDDLNFLYITGAAFSKSNFLPKLKLAHVLPHSLRLSHDHSVEMATAVYVRSRQQYVPYLRYCLLRVGSAC